MRGTALNPVGGDLPLLFEFSDNDVVDKVWNAPERELLANRTLLVSRLLQKLRAQAPQVEWDDEALICEPELGQQSAWRVSCSFQVEDPNWVLPYVEWTGSSDPRYYDPDPEKGRLLLAQTVQGISADEARRTFQRSIEAFQGELQRVALELDQFNQALPYLVSRQIASRLEAIKSGWSLPSFVAREHQKRVH